MAGEWVPVVTVVVSGVGAAVVTQWATSRREHRAAASRLAAVDKRLERIEEKVDDLWDRTADAKQGVALLLPLLLQLFGRR